MTPVRTHGKFTRFAALLIALALALPFSTAFAVPAEQPLTISLQWTDAQGMPAVATAAALPYAGYENAFWVNVPADAPLAALTLIIEDPNNTYALITPGMGTQLTNVIDAGASLTGAMPVQIACYDGNDTLVATYLLYISTTTPLPEQPIVVPKTMELTVHYVSQEYMPVANDEKITLGEGANQPITANPVNLLENYVLQGENVQYVTVDQSSADTGDIFFIYIYVEPVVVPKTMELTVHYVNESYVPVANDEKITLGEGANQPITANPVNLLENYVLQGENVQYVTVDQSSADTGEIFFIYTYVEPVVVPKTMELTIHYVNQEYIPVANDEKMTLGKGANQPITANPVNLLENYVLQGENVQYVTVDQSSADTGEIFFIYTYVEPVVVPKTMELTIHYVNESYVPIADDSKITLGEGANQPVAANPVSLPENYALQGESVQYLTVDAQSPDTYEIFFVYTYVEPVVVPKQMTLTVHYVNREYVPIASDDVTVLSEAVDIPVAANPKDLLPNYVLAGDAVQYLTVDQQSPNTYEISFIYDYIEPVVVPHQMTLTVHYVTSDFVPVASDDTRVLTEGENIPVTAEPKDLLPDYELASDAVQYVTVDANSHETGEIFFIYDYKAPVVEEKTMTLTIHYVNFEMIPVASDDTRTLREGADIPVEASPRDLMANYALTGDAVRYITVDAASPAADEIFFYYEYREPVAQAKTMTLTVHYVSLDSVPVASDEVLTLAEGASIPVTANPRDLIPNYVLSGESVQYVTVDQTSAPTGEITFYYQYNAPVVEPTVTETPAPAPKVALITVQYVNLDDQLLYVETAVPCFEGQVNTIRYDASKLGYGYALNDEAEKTVTVDSNGIATPGVVVFIVREPDEVSITIYYRNLQGMDIASSQTEPCAIGTNSFLANPVNLLPGYELVGENSQSVYLDETGNLSVKEIVFFYQPIATATPDQSTATPFPYTITPMNTYCYPKNDGMNFRASPSSQIETNILRQLSKSELAHIIGMVINDANEDWYYVEIAGIRGFLKGNFVRILSDAEINALLGIVTTATPTPSVTIAPTPIPDGAPIDMWGTLNAGAVNFRRTPQTAGKNILSQLAKNSRAWVYQSITAEDGEKWYSVMVNGTQGYLMAKFVTLMTREENIAYQASLPSPVPTQIPILTATPTPFITLAPTLEPTVPGATDAPTLVPTTAPDIYHGYALTTVQTLLRTGVSLNDDSVLAILPEKTLVNISAQTYVDGVCWDSCDIVGQNIRGFIEDIALRHINNEEALYYINNLSPSVPTSTPTPVPVQYDGYAITQGDNVPMRSFPDTNAKIEEFLQIGSVVMVHGQEYVSGTTWHVVQSGSLWGYIRDDQLRMLSEWEVTGYLESLKTPTPTPNVTQTPTVSENNLSSYGYVDTNKVNLRSAASKSSAKIRMLDEYAFALVLGTVTNEEGTWYQVSQAGTEGYIMSDYFTVLTLGELTEFLQSDNYLNASSDSTAASGSQIQAVEDYNQTVWKNPSLSASYEPFNPYATATPNPEAILTATPSPTPTPTPFSTFAPIGGATTPAPTAPTSSFPYGLVLIAVVLIGGSGAVYAYTIHRRNERRRQAVRAQQMRQASAAGRQPYMRAAQNPAAQQTRAYSAAPYMPPMGGTPRAQQPPEQTSQYQPVARDQAAYQPPREQPRMPTDTSAYAPVRKTPAASAQTTNPYRPVRAQTQNHDAQATRAYPVRPAAEKQSAEATTVYPVIKPSTPTQASGFTVDQPVRRRRSERHQQDGDNS